MKSYKDFVEQDIVKYGAECSSANINRPTLELKREVQNAYNLIKIKSNEMPLLYDKTFPYQKNEYCTYNNTIYRSETDNLDRIPQNSRYWTALNFKDFENFNFNDYKNLIKEVNKKANISDIYSKDDLKKVIPNYITENNNDLYKVIDNKVDKFSSYALKPGISLTYDDASKLLILEKADGSTDKVTINNNPSINYEGKVDLTNYAKQEYVLGLLSQYIKFDDFSNYAKKLEKQIQEDKEKTLTYIFDDNNEYKKIRIQGGNANFIMHKTFKVGENIIDLKIPGYLDFINLSIKNIDPNITWSYFENESITDTDIQEIDTKLKETYTDPLKYAKKVEDLKEQIKSIKIYLSKETEGLLNITFEIDRFFLELFKEKYKDNLDI